MTNLRLILLLFSRNKLREFFFILQITAFVLLLQMVWLPFTSVLEFSRNTGKAFSVSTDSLVFFDPYQGINGIWDDNRESDTFQDILTKLPDSVKYAGRVREEGVEVFTDGRTMIENLVCYSGDMAEMISLKLKEGIFTDELDGAEVPVVIGGTLAEVFHVGDMFSFRPGIGVEVASDQNGDAAGERTALVTGVLDGRAVLPSLHMGGSTRDLKCISVNLSELPNMGFMITAAREGANSGWTYPVLFSVKVGTDRIGVKQELQKLLAGYGIVCGYDELMKNTWNNALSIHQFEVLISILFLLVLLFGFTGYQALLLIRNQRKNAVLSLTGMPRGRLYRLYFSSLTLLAAVSVFFSVLLSSKMKEFIYHGTYKDSDMNRLPVIAGISVILLAAILTSVLIDKRRIREKTPVVLYKESAD